MGKTKLRNPKLKKREELVAAIAGFIGEGVHTALRKFCDSRQSSEAWNAINALPPGEWGTCTTMAADVIVDYLIEDNGLTEIGKVKWR
jgi:hypothetical protein